MQAQTAAPKPDPALRKLHVLVGHWTYEGEYKPGPLGPGGKVTGEYAAQMILGGFFLQGRYTEKGATGEARFLEIDGYDAANKNLTFHLYADDGSTFSGVLTASGNTFTWTGKLVTGGKQYQIKEPFVCAGDFMSGTQRGEVSADGKTWTPFFEAKYTKAKPAAKK
jgi:hypothetical protein